MPVTINLTAGTCTLRIRDAQVELPNTKANTMQALGDVMKVYLFAPADTPARVLDQRAARILLNSQQVKK